MIAPATANVLAKLANGLADDMLTTTVLACTCPKLAAPAMNTAMYLNPATQRNLEQLRGFGFTVVEPAAGVWPAEMSGRASCPSLRSCWNIWNMRPPPRI